MKTMFKFLFVVMLFITSNIYAQWIQTSGPLGGTAGIIASNGGATIFISNNNGAYKSTDNGLNWIPSGLNGVAIGNFFFKGNYVFATNQNGGLYRSGNNGNTWTTMNFNDLVWGYTVFGNYIFATVSDSTQRIIRSSDNGNSWFSLTDTSTHHFFTLMTSNKTYIFAFTNGYLIRSSDNGNLWTKISNVLPPNSYLICVAANGPYIFEGMGGNNGVFRSTDNGLTWSSSGLNNLDISTFTFVGNSFFALGTNGANNTKNGVYRSNDNGTTWTLVNNDIVSTNINTIGSNSNYVFAGMGEQGISRSATKGDDWIVTNNGLKTMTINQMVSLDNDLYTCNDGAGIFYSSDNGNNWTDYNIGLPSDLNVDCLASNKNTYFVYAGTFHGVYYTSPTVDTWTSLNNGLGAVEVRSIGIDGNYMYAATYRNGIYRSTNNGNKWDTTSLQFGRILSIAVGSNAVYSLEASTHGRPWTAVNISTDKGKVWNQVYFSNFRNLVNAIAANGKNVYLGTENGFLRSTNKGVTWDTLNNVITDINIYSVFCYNSTIIIGTYTGKIFKSTNNGVNWINFSNGITNSQPINCFVNNNSALFLGSQNNSVWRNNVLDNPSLVSNSEDVKSANLFQNYPNPFNPSTKIGFSLANDGMVKLVIYDVLGKEVTKIVDRELKKGNYEFEWNASNYPSGTYFYKLIGEGFSETKRLVLVK